MQSVTANSIFCIPTAPSGSHAVSVRIDGYGYSIGSISATVPLSVTKVITAHQSSYAGGVQVSLEGSGLNEDLEIYLCGFQCEVIQSTGASLTFISPPLITSYSQRLFSIATDPNVITNFTVIASSSSNRNNVVDGNPDSS